MYRSAIIIIVSACCSHGLSQDVEMVMSSSIFLKGSNDAYISVPCANARRHPSNVGDSTLFFCTLVLLETTLSMQHVHRIREPRPHTINGVRLVCFGRRHARSTIHDPKCLLLSRWRAFRVVLIVKTPLPFDRLTGPPYSTKCAGRMPNQRMFQELKEILIHNVSSPFLPIGISISPYDCSGFVKISTWWGR